MPNTTNKRSRALIRFEADADLRAQLAALAREHERTPGAEARFALRSWIAQHTADDDTPAAA